MNSEFLYSNKPLMIYSFYKNYVFKIEDLRAYFTEESNRRSRSFFAKISILTFRSFLKGYTSLLLNKALLNAQIVNICRCIGFLTSVS